MRLHITEVRRAVITITRTKRTTLPPTPPPTAYDMNCLISTKSIILPLTLLFTIPLLVVATDEGFSWVGNGCGEETLTFGVMTIGVETFGVETFGVETFGVGAIGVETLVL